MKTTGLSLGEAHASGRSYARLNDEHFFRYDGSENIDLDEALAMDYELEPETKLLTREQVYDALNVGLKAYALEYRYTMSFPAIDKEAVIKALFGREDSKE